MVGYDERKTTFVIRFVFFHSSLRYAVRFLIAPTDDNTHELFANYVPFDVIRRTRSFFLYLVVVRKKIIALHAVDRKSSPIRI